MSDISGLSMKDRRVANFRFRVCSACRPRSEAGLCVCTSGPISIRAKPTFVNSSVTLWEDNAPLKLPTRHCPSWFLPMGLELTELKMAVSLLGPCSPKGTLQPLATTLRMSTVRPIPSYSKASGVFSSCCRYPASSRESHFHRALR